MGTCSKCGRAESKTVPLAFVWDVWTYKEVCRYGCKDRAGSPLEVAYCFSCGKAVELRDARPHICGPCFDGVPADSRVEKLYAYAGKPLTPVVLPAPASVIKQPVVEAKQDESRICSSGTVAVGRYFRDGAENIWQVTYVEPTFFNASMVKCVKKVADRVSQRAAFRFDGKYIRGNLDLPFIYDFVEWVVAVKSVKPKTDAKSRMKDYLTVEIDECAGTLKIVKQRNQNNNPYGEGTAYRFRASNGTLLESRIYPEYVPHDRTLYLRGCGTSHDNDVIRIPISHIPDIVQAVAEYNEFWSKQSV